MCVNRARLFFSFCERARSLRLSTVAERKIQRAASKMSPRPRTPRRRPCRFFDRCTFDTLDVPNRKHTHSSAPPRSASRGRASREPTQEREDWLQELSPKAVLLSESAATTSWTRAGRSACDSQCKRTAARQVRDGGDRGFWIGRPRRRLTEGGDRATDSSHQPAPTFQPRAQTNAGPGVPRARAALSQPADARVALGKVRYLQRPRPRASPGRTGVAHARAAVAIA